MKNGNNPQDHPIVWREFCEVAPRLGLPPIIDNSNRNLWSMPWNFFLHAFRVKINILEQINERDNR